MTKKIIAVLALSLVSSSAFASQAKNLISGTGDAGNILGTNGMNGSFYTNDEYNIFWNPAFINGQRNWAIVEGGSNAISTGFATDIGSLSVAAFLNRPAAAGRQAIDVIIGGDMGLKWGLGLTQTLSQTTTNPASNTVLKAGVVVADFEPFVAYTVKQTTNGTNDSDSFTVGTRYHFGEWTPYAAYQNSDLRDTWGLGLGRMAKMGDVSMNYSMSYWNLDGSFTVPVQMVLAADATSWLVARAGFQHALRGTGATSVNFGGTFKLGKADLDMVVGRGGTFAETGENRAFGLDGNLFANASLTYNW